MTDERNAAYGIELLLKFLGQDPYREGLRETPDRVIRAFEEMTSGYKESPKVLLGTTFDAESYDELIIVRDIEFVSLCEHHLMPFEGTATVGYLPDRRIVGLSKIPRLVDCFAKRLQVQERLTVQISNAISSWLEPLGCGTIIKAYHSCTACRGVKKRNVEMVTSSLLGVFREDYKIRGEFLGLSNS
jgi:GTP cyclohydrolase IA